MKKSVGSPTSKRYRFLGAVACATLLVGSMCSLSQTGLATAQDASQDAYVWSEDLDCALCHEREVATVGIPESGGVTNSAGKTTRPAAEAVVNQVQTSSMEDNASVSSASRAADDLADAAAGAAASSGKTADTLDDYATTHVEDQGFTCFTCHSDQEGLAEAHNEKKLNSGKEARRLKKTEISSEFCLTCHDANDLIQATTDSQALTDENGTVVNPHDLPVNESHSDLTCVNCHKAHDEEQSLTEASMATCSSCHHTQVFECHTCHS